MKDLTLIIPAKWESESLPLVLKELKKYNCKKLIVIPKNDYSTFNSIKNFRCNILKQKKNGFGSAIIEGIKKVRTKYLCIFNADGSFNPKYLKNMIVYLGKKNKDFVFNSRYEKKGGSDDDTFLTYVGNKFFTTLCNLIYNFRISDVLFTFVMGKTILFKNLNLKESDFRLCVELPLKVKLYNFRIVNNPCYERVRLKGKKKVNEFRDGFLILLFIVKNFFKKL
jgi:hypothetical protein